MIQHCLIKLNTHIQYKPTFPLQDIHQGWDFPGGAVVKNTLANTGDTGSIPGPGKSHMPRSH